MKYGYFDDLKKEYVITNPLTPLPWINYLGNNGYYGLISHSGGGYTFYQDAKLRRLTRYRYNNVPKESGGRYYYICDGKETFNPGYFPLENKLDEYSTRHGLGYTVITSVKNNLKVVVTYFIPLNDNVEIHKVIVENLSNENKNIKIYGLTEWALWNAVDDQTNFQRNLNIGEVEVTEQTIFHKTEYRERRNHFAYYHVNQKISGFDTNRDQFLGAYKGYDKPEVVLSRKSKNSITYGGSPIASLEVSLDLKPNEKKELVYQLGYFENKENSKFDKKGFINKRNVLKQIEKYEDIDYVNQEFKKLNTFWNETLSKYEISSSEEKLDRMVNIWHQYQCMVTFNMSRSASFFESGTGRGMGFRDSCQDILGFVHMIPDKARQRIIDLASIQFKDGSTYHQYQPLTKRGNADIGGGFNDDPLWLIGAASAYLKETGDFSILKEMVPFNNVVEDSDTLLNHLRKSIDYTLNNLGPHGLPLIGRADWNDCLNLNCYSTNPGESFQTTENIQSKAESVFIAGMFVQYGREYIEICEKLNLLNEAKRIEEKVLQMEKSVIDHGWDGKWFLRAYDANYNKVGSAENKEGKIYIEPQGFCTMALIGGSEYAKKALMSAKKYLENDYGMELLYPPYSKYYLELGEISSYPPGQKENGSVFCHNNPWVVIGFTKIKDGENAYALYTKNAPAFIEDKSDIHKTEPYVYSQTISGRSSKTYGEAKNSFLTGTASWAFVAVSQHILGVRPDFDGLIIDPVLPKHLDNITVKRVFRNKIFNIQIIRDKKMNQQLVVDGKKQKDNILIKLNNKQKVYEITKYII
ncbi:Cellobiose phosphorylase [Alteracholeplasma palmae J233]|uniref:Cellobiose phosphorylase n=1 Tax=Alteracholeplasma palmae (strain ATCC 49389 / J233) TaxID=1318466 RepID=U4KL06_ALTPJ|nr:hypothetical protein [Alteracholeplasma palmae]CCV64529.1 Cellobiose phosphorylase [Alteracholeplasma palmae J233]